MQSTVSSSVTTQAGNFESLNELLSLSAVEEEFYSQAETSNRMPVLSGISLAQQVRRMRLRPDSLVGIQAAESNRFDVFSDALAITCNHPSMFSALQTGPTNTLSGLPMLKGDKISNHKPTLLLGFDFADRSWPAYEPEPSQSPVIEKAPVRWNMSGQKPRISAVYDRVPSIIENPDHLRALVDEARQRDAQRITAKLRIISARRPEDILGRAIDATQEALAKLKFQLNVVRTYFGHLNNRENYTIMG